MEKLSRKELIDLVEKIIKFKGSDEELDEMIDILEKNIIDPEVTKYIYWDDLTPEEIVDKALSYQPILL